MPEWLAALLLLFAFAQGFILGGIVYGRSPLWDGVRSIYRFGR